MQTLSDTQEFGFIGGDLSLDFCNTGENREHGIVHDLLNDYRGLVSWAAQANLLTSEEALYLAALEEQHPAEAQRIYERAMTLREALYRTFSAIAAEHPTNDADLAILNQELAAGLGHLRLSKPADDYAWTWDSQPEDMDRMLWPVAKSAADLLLSPVHHNLRECENGNCSWLFLDLSRNHSRRWCTMRSCGNQVKAKNYRQRSKDSE